MTNPSDSITVTREELERDFVEYILPVLMPTIDDPQHFRKTAKFSVATLFTNAKAREEEGTNG